MLFINFTATTATYRFKYLIIIGLSGGRRGGRRVTVVAEEGLFFDRKGSFLSIFCAITSKFASIFMLISC